MSKKKATGYMQPVQIRMPKPLRDKVFQHCKAESEARGLFYSTAKFVREAIDEKLGRGRRVERLG